MYVPLGWEVPLPVLRVRSITLRKSEIMSPEKKIPKKEIQMMATSDTTGSIEQPATPTALTTTTGDPVTFDVLALDRMLIESRIRKAKTSAVQEFLYNILFLLERGDVKVYTNPMTGELHYEAKELN
jgi:hypothetical protein|tara:strand:+ start:4735 stop:5115 length:381 start_codon:yes stop_codon:yes gene_type:complete